MLPREGHLPYRRPDVPVTAPLPDVMLDPGLQNHGSVGVHLGPRAKSCVRDLPLIPSEGPQTWPLNSHLPPGHCSASSSPVQA